MKGYFTIEWLERQVKENNKRIRDNQKKKYHYAKSLGFSASEAVILQNKSMELITRLSEEKKQ